MITGSAREHRILMPTASTISLTPGRNGPVWLALVLLTGVFMLGLQTLTPPAPVGEAAPADTFSAGRAETTLRFLLGDETPHPVGSLANQAVRDRLLETLRALDLEVSVQRSVGCAARWPICANVDNVLAQIPGETTDTIVLMAHYDSVPHAPGAADDGAGVASLIEIARILQAQPVARNSVLFVFTDAEEVGLLGAEAFFNQHPAAANVKAVINVEGGGSGGPALLLRTTADGGRLLQIFRERSAFPAATSVAQEVFARMPNDTDFSVSERSGIPGIDFSFAFEFNHYHTPLDTVDNLDKGSLQHHGENVLPLVQGLLNTDLGQTQPNFVYLTPAQAFWIAWPTSWSVPLAVGVLLLLVVCGYRTREQTSIRATLGGTALALTSLTLSLLACFSALWLSSMLMGTTVDFPAEFWPSRLIMYGAAALPACLLGAWASRRLGFWSLFLGVWWLLGLLAALLAIEAPLASNLLLIPAVVAAVTATIVVFTGQADRGRAQLVLALISICALGFTMMLLSYANEQTQGLRLAPAIYTSLALLALGLLPLRPGISVSLVMLLVVIGGLIWSATAPLYSSWRPQHVSLHYVLDLDERSAQWAAFSANPLPEMLLSAMGPDITEAAPTPWSRTSRPTAPAPVLNLPAPEVNVERTGNRVVLQIRSRGDGDMVGVAIPASAGISNLRLAGQRLPVEFRGDYLQSGLFAAGQTTVKISFELDTPEQLVAYVIDLSNRLPQHAAELVGARGDLAVPQHRGDQSIAYRRVKF
jgi:hypothetical protein